MATANSTKSPCSIGIAPAPACGRARAPAELTQLGREQALRGAVAGHREERVDRLVRQLAQHGSRRDSGGGAFRVHVQAHQRRRRHPGERVDLRRQRAKLGEQRLGRGVVAQHRAVDHDELATADRGRDLLERRQLQDAERAGDLVRGVDGPAGPGPEHLLGVLPVPDQHSGVRGLDRVEPELHRGDDPEVATAAPDRPEQVGLVLGVGAHQPAVGGDQLDRSDAVGGHAEGPGVPPDAAAEGVADDADVGGGAVQRGQAERRHGLDHVDPEAPAPTRAIRDAASTVTSRIAEVRSRTVSARSPSGPALCPVPCGATRSPAADATRTTSTTSSADAG
jgi:hypothetical protein